MRRPPAAASARERQEPQPARLAGQREQRQAQEQGPSPSAADSPQATPPACTAAQPPIAAAGSTFAPALWIRRGLCRCSHAHILRQLRLTQFAKAIALLIVR